MKKKLRVPFSMRMNLTLIMMGEVAVVTGLGYLMAWLMNYFHVRLLLPDVVWLLAVSIILGFLLTFVLGHWIFMPITRLSNAMRLVAGGNFQIRLKEHHQFREIEDIYANFNRMTGELEATEILQTDFVSSVSHEFKTPINAIEGYATLLQGHSEELPEEVKPYVDKILFNTGRLSKLVGNILLLSKVENQSIGRQVTTFRLDEQIRQAILQLEPEWEGNNIWLDVELETLSYTGSEGLLFHVWTNLIGNAIKFSPEGGRVRLLLRQQGQEILFQVEDQGPGIPEEDKAHIFDKFYQGDSSHKQEGNGVGLALVKRILFTEGGWINVENLPEGGCRFTAALNINNC